MSGVEQVIDQLVARQVIKQLGIEISLEDRRNPVQYVSEVLATTEACMGEIALQAELRRFENPDPQTPGQLQAANLTANVRPHTV